MNLKKAFAESWWVLALLSICFLLYLQAVKEKQAVIAGLDERIEKLEEEKFLASDEQEEMSLIIESKEDPAYVEMILKKELGLVPENQEKVTFDK